MRVLVDLPMKNYLIVIILFLNIHSTTAYFYPPLFWHKDNCGFRRLEFLNGTKEYFIKVVPNNGMNVVCPNQVTVNNWLKETGILSPTLYENMWWVQDKASYDQCKVGVTNKQILVCDEPRKIKYTPFLFNPRFNNDEPRFAPGQHYYFISTSRGVKEELTTRKESGIYGSCTRYHMKLHIYVCDPKKEDCLWHQPRCAPFTDLHRDMRLINGKLPAPTMYIKAKPSATSYAMKNTYHDKLHMKNTLRNVGNITTTAASSISQSIICEKKEKGTSIHLILNFVLGGIAIFMAIVIIVLVFGLSGKKKIERRLSNASTNVDLKNYLTMEVIQLPDGNTQLSPVMMSRTPPVSPTYLIDLQQQPPLLLPTHHAVQQPSHHIPPPPPPPPESDHSNRRSFVFPERRRHSYSGTTSMSSTRDSKEVPVPV